MSHIHYYVDDNQDNPNKVPPWATANHEKALVAEINPKLANDFLRAISLDKTDPFKEQVGGDHYKTMKIQPIEYILANDLGFCEANIVKYISRYKQKNGVQDVKKVIHYAEMLLAHLEEQANDIT